MKQSYKIELMIMRIFQRNAEIFLICAFFRDWEICAIINVVWCRCFGLSYVGAKMFIFYSFLKCAQNFCENPRNFQEFGRVYKKFFLRSLSFKNKYLKILIIIVKMYFKGNLKEFYFTKGSQDQFCLQNVIYKGKICRGNPYL